jgi:hypothetical protein
MVDSSDSCKPAAGSAMKPGFSMKKVSMFSALSAVQNNKENQLDHLPGRRNTLLFEQGVPTEADRRFS